MRKDTLIFIGLDTHKESTDAAYEDDNRGSTVSIMAKYPPQNQQS